MEKVSKLSFNLRIGVLAVAVFVLDQLTKFLLVKYVDYAQENVVIPGFFKLVHWGNTGVAWSLFHGNNNVLAVIAIVALLVLFFARHYFDIDRLSGQISLGLIFGGIVGNLTDRLMPSRNHVIDFLYFYVITRNGEEAGFPAFNVADTAICTAVGLLFLASWVNESRSRLIVQKS